MAENDQKQEKAQERALEEAGVATEKQNAKLEHSQGGSTTRDDQNDVGVPMLAGDPSEPQGPEDALGRGPKRGDYRNRLHTDSSQAVPTENGGEPRYAEGPDGEDQIVDFEPVSRVEAQNPRAEDIGDAEGEKGGVDTDPIAAP